MPFLELCLRWITVIAALDRRTCWGHRSHCWWSLWPLHCWLCSLALWSPEICPFPDLCKHKPRTVWAQDLLMLLTCMFGFVAPIRFIISSGGDGISNENLMYTQVYYHTSKRSLMYLDTVLWTKLNCWEMKKHCISNIFAVFLITHRHPPTSPPPSCLCWWRACLCCRGHSVDWQGWHCVLAAPCGETHSQGPCAPSGFSTDLNNCKMHKGFARGRNKNLKRRVSHCNKT